MGNFSFMQLNPTQTTTLLPQMFDILYANMSCIAPTGNSREEDWRLWQSYMASEQNRAQVILMYADDTLAGYFQYRIEGDTLCADEIEIRPQVSANVPFLPLSPVCRPKSSNEAFAR